MKFRFVDRITSFEPGKRISGSKTVSFEEYSLQQPLGDEATLPRTLVLESFFQLGNWLIILSSDFAELGMIVRFERISFEGDVLPGERMDMDIEVVSRRSDGILFQGVGRVGGRVVATGLGCLAVPAPLAEFHDPEHLKVLYSEIFRPATG